MGIKRFIYNRLFNERQRNVIWQAILFSEHTYRRRGNVDAAAYVRTVINETANTAGVKQRFFSEEEVVNILNAKAEQIANEKLQKVGKEIKTAFDALAREKKPINVEAFELDLEKCKQCERLDSCLISPIIKKFIKEREEEKAGEEEQKPEEKPSETAEENDGNTATSETEENENSEQ